MLQDHYCQSRDPSLNTPHPCPSPCLILCLPALFHLLTTRFPVPGLPQWPMHFAVAVECTAWRWGPVACWQEAWAGSVWGLPPPLQWSTKPHHFCWEALDGPACLTWTPCSLPAWQLLVSVCEERECVCGTAQGLGRGCLQSAQSHFERPPPSSISGRAWTESLLSGIPQRQS